MFSQTIPYKSDISPKILPLCPGKTQIIKWLHIFRKLNTFLFHQNLRYNLSINENLIIINVFIFAYFSNLKFIHCIFSTN